MSAFRSRSPLAVALLTAAIIWVAWAIGLFLYADLGVVARNYFMSVTMVAGSFIAGATSEGGGAVAFPVMTLVFKIAPAVARDFSLMIQTVGMGAATLTILAMGVPVVWRALLWCSIGGALGIVLGIEVVAPMLPPPFAKMLFLSTWLAFAVALYLINKHRAREVHEQIPLASRRDDLALFLVGIIGGTISGITGSGLDITTFSLLVLAMRVSESVATPTSVILMAINASVGFLWKSTFGEGMAPEAWDYWWACVPIVVIGAPAGARFIRDRSRLFVAGILYVSIGVQFIAGLLIIPQTRALLLFSSCAFLLGLGLFRGMSSLGNSRLGAR